MVAGRKKTVAITGAAEPLGVRLVEALCRDEEVERVLGFDVREIHLRHEKLVFDILDVRNLAFEVRLAGTDVLVHLAFMEDLGEDENVTRDVNVNGSQNVFRCAGRAGVGKIVYVSSGEVYGAHPDNDLPLTESSPLRANLDFSHAAQRLEVEYVVREFQDEFPDVPVVLFRPCIVVGPSVDSIWSRLVEMPVLVGVRGHRPPLQFVHEDDVVAALVFGVHGRLRGPYNLAPDDSVPGPDLPELLRRTRLELPEAAAFALVERLWSLRLSEAPGGILHYLMYPWVASPKRLEAAGFVARYSSRDALLAAGRMRRHLRVGPARLHAGHLLRAAAAGAGVAAAALGLRAVRRRGAPVRT